MADGSGISSCEICKAITETLPNTIKKIIPFSDTDHDLDVALILGNNESKVRVIELLSDLLVILSLKANRLITITPLHEIELNTLQTGFIKNVAKARQNHSP